MADSTLAGPTTIVEEGTECRGDFTSRGPIVVNGRINGAVKAPTVTVTQSGHVQGKVAATSIDCRGSVAGVLEADTIELSGSIAQNTVIRAQRLKLNIESTSGRIELAFGQAVTVRESGLPPPGGEADVAAPKG
jgi:cytoskeletal protein CcmA (bactofilin family)